MAGFIIDLNISALFRYNFYTLKQIKEKLSKNEGKTK